jgi:transcriptional regulator with XRE-family HTH domain
MSDARARSFDNDGFFAALDATRRARDLTWRQIAKQANVSPSTLTRVGQGKRPDVDSFAALAAWAGLNPEDFIPTSTGPAEPLTEISMLLRKDPNLTPEAATALDELLQATYRRLRDT